MPKARLLTGFGGPVTPRPTELSDPLVRMSPRLHDSTDIGVASRPVERHGVCGVVVGEATPGRHGRHPDAGNLPLAAVPRPVSEALYRRGHDRILKIANDDR